MCISVVTRALRTSELLPLTSFLSSEKNVEIIAVCVEKDSKLPGDVSLILERAGRLRAKVTGVRASHCDRILFLDADQFPEHGLFQELMTLGADMVVIPERSLTGGISGLLMDDWRKRMEKWAASQHHPSPTIPVVPRVFWRDQLLHAIERIPDPVIDGIVSHEDSVLYAAVAIFTSSLTFSRSVIFNADPSIIAMLRKAFNYGYYHENARIMLEDVDGARPYLELTNALNLASIKFHKIGLGPGYVLQALRGLTYVLGISIARFINYL
ncbi:MAG: hypothetical protein ACP5G6_08670 [Conexivisphaera sp.]